MNQWVLPDARAIKRIGAAQQPIQRTQTTGHNNFSTNDQIRGCQA
ncbi:MAG: hypothetical protein ACJ71R_02200 [Nitrososphaeraceae archaeon]